MDEHLVEVVWRRPHLSARTRRCPDCDGDGYLLVDGIAGACSCRPARIAASYISQAKIPAEAYPAVSAIKMPLPKLGVVEKRAYDRARRALAQALTTAQAFDAGTYLDNATPFAAVAGVAGSGKTWLIAHAVKRACLLRVGAAYVSAADPFAAGKSFGEGHLERGWEILHAVPFLAIDDVGGHRNETSSGMVRDLIQARAHASMVTVASTRQSMDDLAIEFGPSIADLFRANRSSLTHGSLRGIG